MFDRLIAFRARQSPHAVAISMPTADVSYQHLDRAIEAVATALVTDVVWAELPSLAALRIDDPYVEWLVLLGLSRLGVPTVSPSPSEAGAVLPILRPELVIADQPKDPRLRLDASWWHASKSWLDAALKRADSAPPPRTAVDPDALARVCTSSGTSGQPKMIPLSWRQVETRMLEVVARAGSGGTLARFMPLINAGAAAFVQGLAVWAAGGTLVLAPRDIGALAAALTRLRPTGAMMSPAQLEPLLAALPAGFVPLPDLTVSVAGSHLPIPLRREARLRLSPNLLIVYGSTEAGATAQGHTARLEDEASCGWVLPWLEAEVVDDGGRPVPPGTLGLLRIRGAGVAHGYLGSDADDRHFQDGWFTAGDLASLGPDGLLRIEGRADEVLNFGGVKVAPLRLEQAALSCAGVRDAGAFALQDEAGVPRPWLALVRGDGFDPAALDRALGPLMPALPPIRVAWIEAIPRNANGKIERARLRTAAAALPAPR